MKNRHTKAYYEKWVSMNGFTLLDIKNYIHSHYGHAIETYQVIDYLYNNQLTAHELRCLVSY